jgi:hypothetical protein
LKELLPFTDAMASLFSAIKFRDNFKAPIHIVPKDGTFNLINEVETWLGWEKGSITLNPQNTPPTVLAGMINAKKDSANILYCVQEFTVCWRRLVIAKELCHVIYAALDYDDLPLDAEAVLDAAVYDHLPYNPECHRGEMEIIAHALAPHLLVPFWEHPDIMNSTEKVSTLAAKYRVPGKTIEEIRDGQHEAIAGMIKKSYQRNG